MTDLIPTSQAMTLCKVAISTEFDRLIKELMAKRAIRKSMLGNGYYVIYTEDGPMDLNLARIAPCLKAYPGNCICWECTNA